MSSMGIDSNGRIVMVVDDDPDIRATLVGLLSDEGYRVIAAENGVSALRELRNGGEPPSVILLDLMMPVMNGAEFYAEKQRDPRLAAIPTIILSADGHIARKAPGYTGESLAKPLRIEALLSAIARHTP
jgi:CheY-like chemotaxis protein